jgi:uncharacterized protein
MSSEPESQATQTSDQSKPVGQPLAPVAAPQRLEAVDILRGFAVLGILAINIEFFGLSETVFFNPAEAGGFEGVNYWVWHISYLLFNFKMMAIFSMLFGAGMVLMHQRAEAAGRPLGRIYYRRLLWLFLIGMAHAYLFWYGDILVSYALCGLIIYLLRRRSPLLLAILGVVVLSIGGALLFGSSLMFDYLRSTAEKVERAEQTGEEVTDTERQMVQAWEEASQGFAPTPEKMAEEVEAYRGGFLDALKHRFPQTLTMQTQGFFFMVLWRVLGLMLLGMALMKWRVFSAERSSGFYIGMTLIGYGLGLPAVWYGITLMEQQGFDFIAQFGIGGQFNYFFSVVVALGHTGLVMIAIKRGWIKWLLEHLRAAGRMALTNYLMQTLICTTIFYGYGFGLFNRLDRVYLALIVVAVWILQLGYSSVLLKHYRFGPAEWLWRSLTYWRRQPMKA